MNLLKVIGEILYPWPLNCMYCGAASDGEGPLCAECRTKLDEDATHMGFASSEYTGSAAAHWYKGPAGLMVRLLKYSTMKQLAGNMAVDMIRAAREAGLARPDMVTYVPMHWRHRQSRYINQAQVLAEAVARELDVPCVRALKRIKGGRQQAKIKDEAVRVRNLRGVFVTRMDVADKHVLLIDDVYTTGATSRECRIALMDAGVRSVALLVYCRAR